MKQLVYKKFMNEDGDVVTNSAYLQQVWTKLHYPGIVDTQVKGLGYRSGDLVNFFCKYNKAYQEECIDYSRVGKQDQFSVKLKGGVAFSSIDLIRTLPSTKILELPGSTVFYPSVEFEYAFASLNDVFSIVLAPSYISYSASIDNYPDRASLNYQALEIPLGFRYNREIGANLKLFASALFDWNVPLADGSIVIYGDRARYFKLTFDFMLNAGLEYKDRYTIELNYQVPHDILWGYPSWDSKYRVFSLFLGYRLFSL